MSSKKRIAIFASGNGSNAEAIISKLNGNQTVEVASIYSNNSNAYVLERANNHGIVSFVFNREEYRSINFLDELINKKYDLIVLAGFVWLVPEKLVEAYPDKIINIHPALLPKFGGKGMYGHHVHEAVIKNGETQSGITIHYVNENYDEGNIILQKSCQVLSTDTADSLAERIHSLEHKHYPQVVQNLCDKISS